MVLLITIALIALTAVLWNRMPEGLKIAAWGVCAILAVSTVLGFWFSIVGRNVDFGSSGLTTLLQLTPTIILTVGTFGAVAIIAVNVKDRNEREQWTKSGSQYTSGNAIRGKHEMLPIGYEFLVEVVGVEQRPAYNSISKEGTNLVLTLEVAEGLHEGKTTTMSLPIENEDRRKQNGARAKLHRICQLAGLPWPLEDDELLFGGQFRIHNAA